MKQKLWLASGAALMLAFASAAATAGHNHGGGGGGFGGGGNHGGGGPSLSGSRAGGNFGTFYKSGPSNFSPGSSGQWKGGPGKSANNGGPWHGDNRHRGRHFAAYPYFYGGYYDNYAYDSGYGDCGWLYRRAVETGSRYWWRRYQDCID